MTGIHDYWAFVGAGILLNLTPGQDTLYIAGRSLAEGRRIGIASALGISTGCMVHISAAAFGLSALLMASATAFTLVKWAGVAYLCYMGLRQLLEHPAGGAIPETGPATGGFASAYRRGILTNVLNPKVAVFFLAFLPQFVDGHGPHRTLAFLLLGGTFLFTGTVWCLCVSILVAGASSRLRAPMRHGTILRRASGAVMIALGIRLALQRAR